jgi:3-oxoadipate enol-lactonase
MTQWSTEKIGPAPRLAVDHAGTGELVVFLHGIGGNRTNWHDQLPAFAEHFHAAAWDARGYGDSDDYDGPLTFTQYADDLPRVLDHFGAEKAHIVGLSMGGRIAMDFAARHADRLRSLVLCDTHRGLSHLSDEKRREFVRLRKEPLLNGGEPKDIAAPVARTLIGRNASEAAFQKLVDSMSRLHKESYIKSIEASVMAGAHGGLGSIRVPTLVVVGEDDHLTPPAEAQVLADTIPGARLVVIPEAGHLSNIEKPAAFNDAVLGFLRQVAGS